jgi:type IV pilus assembly protein PilV
MMHAMVSPQNRGFALTEVLVATALLGVGLLGHAALLVKALQSERDAMYRATAATVSTSLAERIRANIGAGAAYSLEPGVDDAVPTAACTPALPTDASTRAACDLAEWRYEVSNSLPAATAVVTTAPIAGSAGNLYTITIRWLAPGPSGGGEFTLQVQT